jgi:hypothetical protein
MAYGVDAALRELALSISNLSKRLRKLEVVELPPFPTFPRTAFIKPDLVQTSVTFLYASTSSSNRVKYHRSTTVSDANDGDEFKIGFCLAAGTYNFNHVGSSGTSRGKVDHYLDGNLISSGQDWYLIATVWDYTRTITMVVPESGDHVMTLKINGKHASSTDYTFAVEYFWITPIAY